jgi:hypothetical protein
MSKFILSFSNFLKVHESYRNVDKKSDYWNENSMKKYKSTDLITAVENDDLDDTLDILNSPYGDDISYINFQEQYDYDTALHIAVRNLNPVIVKALLDKGADPNIMGGGREGALDALPREHADSPEYQEIFNLLQEHGAEIQHVWGHP